MLQQKIKLSEYLSLILFLNQWFRSAVIYNT